MVKEIKTEKFEGLAVLVPDDTSGYAMKGKEIIFDVKHGLNKIYQELPFECVVVVGCYPGLSNEACSVIVTQMKDSTYPFEVEDYKVTFENLMSSLGCDLNLTWLILKKLTN